MKYRELSEVFEHKKHGTLECVLWEDTCTPCVFSNAKTSTCQRKRCCGIGRDREDGKQTMFIKVKQ